MGSSRILPIEQVCREWNACHGAFFQVSENDLLWNAQEQHLLKYSGAQVGKVPVLYAEATSAGADHGILRTGLWVSLWGKIPRGEEGAFVAEVMRLAKEAGKTRIAFGSEEFHFLPGVPAEDALVKACQDAGFSAYDCADFSGAPANPQAKDYTESALSDSKSRGWSFQRAESGENAEALSRFLAQEFPGRWSREWNFWRTRKDAQKVRWYLLRDEGGNSIGFSRIGMRGWGSGGFTPGAMRLPLGEEKSILDTDSCLGPIGISASERGRGAGKILLGHSLHELSLHGAKRTCIDWTNAYNYYTPLGFAIIRRYQCLWKDL